MIKKLLAATAASIVLAGCNVTAPQATAPASVAVEEVKYTVINDAEVFKTELGNSSFNAQGDIVKLSEAGMYFITKRDSGDSLTGTWKFANGFWCLTGQQDGCYKWEKASTGDHYKVTSEFGIGTTTFYYPK